MNMKFLKKIICFTLTMMLCVPISKMETQAATSITETPMICYTISNGKVTTYKSVNGAYSGYIDGSTDKCTILEVYDSGWVKVKYPISGSGGKYKTAYTESSNFFVNTDFSTTKLTLGSNKTVYRRADMSQSLGTVYGSDQIMIVGSDGLNTQIIYPLSNGSGYKLGWINGIYTTNGDTEVMISDGYYQIISAIDNSYVLDVYGISQDNCANVQIYENNKGLNQGFLIKRESNGYYTITALHSNKVLDVEKGGKTSGSNIIQYQLNGSSASDNQLWKIYKTSDGYFRFQSKSNGLYMDVNGGVASNGVNVQCWESNTTNAQKFQLEEARVDGKTYSESNSNVPTEDKAQAIVDYELSQLGIGDNKGDNNCVYNTWYYGRTISGNGYAWCQVFQAYCANQIGVLDTAIPYTNNCSAAIKWYNQRGEFYLSQAYGGYYTPKAGDLVFYGANGSSHVGMIIASPVDGYLQVVEGNCYTSNGDYTVQKFTKNAKRRVDNSYVYGYASPSY